LHQVGKDRGAKMPISALPLLTIGKDRGAKMPITDLTEVLADEQV
jgi:hypothetical protein